VDHHVSRDRAEFGVLFVHGIGQQGPGRTVASFAAALYSWLFRWNCPEDMPPEKSPTFRHAVLSPELGGDPAHVSLAVPLDLSDGQHHARWLLAESQWANAFTPRFLDLAHWIWKVSTCLLVVQFVIPMRRHWRKTRPDATCRVPAHKRLAHAPVVLCYAILIGVAAMSSVLVSILLLALAVAAKLPVPRIDLAVQWVVVKLAAMLGDSYVLARCPVQFAAMRTQVARDLSWLQDRCDRVAVVAHSQGAAIAHHYYASADPVSNGPLPADANSGAAPAQAPLGGHIGRPSRCEEVYNSASILTDHNGYLHNQDQFLSELVNDLVAAAHGDSLTDPARRRLVLDNHLYEARKRRRWLVAWLVSGRAIVAGLGIVMWWFNPGRTLKGPMNYLLQPVPPHAQMSDGLARPVAVVLIAAAIYMVAVLLPWRIMEKRSTQRFFRTARPSPQRAGAEPTVHEPTGLSEEDGVGQGLHLAGATRP